ncbi:MAG: cysteine--1-D-myo-inosityl 2-amino-2-deoxy-alpha-D-glucopyranoside ligase [Propionibacteriaceae bacterium]|jgi:L-cysteine:1D-myo-inositol 2-amino-2-deoxy-alpha-D-glucopyranoside ligase|nr:cysteine--1-D-myo-inosityl 2-amino-2-deoxy-alpha-D-glucopyranoside ligase [Propionibacteriaceae bacterium]
MQAWPNPTLPTLDPPGSGRLRLADPVSGAVKAVGPERGQARMYVCGITPYDATHLGHAFTYTVFDLANRVWRDLGRTVVYTQNVTDVDEPLLERAAQTGVDWRDLAAGQTDLFRSDMTALRVLPPLHYVGAVESISLVSGLLARLADRGAVYQAADREHPDWYFDTAAAAGFGGVSHLGAAAMRELFADRGGDPGRLGKRSPLDPLVWRLARPGEPAWDAPVGRGRPGWHIECTAIALDTLGAAFDLQGGGSDLAFPHHEMCAAQAAAVTGQPLAQAYLHVGMVGLDGEKMSKSKGNLVLVSQLLAGGADPMAIRLALLAHHYGADWSWQAADLAAAQIRLARWRSAAVGGGAADAARLAAEVRAALLDDLHADRALAAVDRWAAASAASAALDPAAAASAAAVADALLGVRLSVAAS